MRNIKSGGEEQRCRHQTPVCDAVGVWPVSFVAILWLYTCAVVHSWDLWDICLFLSRVAPCGWMLYGNMNAKLSTIRLRSNYLNALSVD